MKILRPLVRSLGIAVLILLVAPLGYLWVTGDTYLEVTGKSMEPTFRVGDVLVVRPATGNELRHEGEIVVVRFAETDSRYVHRVHEVTSEGTWLKGDNNPAKDPAPVSQSDVVGVPRFALPGDVGAAFIFSQSVAGRIVGGALALFLLMTPIPRTFRPGSTDTEQVDDQPQTKESSDL